MTYKDRTFRNGLFLVLLGPDGAGKSTLVDRMRHIAANEFRVVEHFHWRPGLLPKLSRRNVSLKMDQHENAATGEPPTESAYGTVISLARYLYYLADFVIGYWWVIRPQVRRGALVLGERWYYDVVAYPARYGFKLPGWVLKMGAYLVPDPDLTVLLSAEPDAIHARKPELPSILIGDQLRKLRALLPAAPFGVELSSGCDLDETAREMHEAILDRRPIVCRDPTRVCDVWKGFPRYGEVKLWIGPSDTLKNAMDLYHPYSRFGKLVVWLAKAFPDMIARRLFCRDFRTREESLCVNQILALVARFDERRDLAVSISTGTPGPHRKQTAQLAIGGVPAAYAKFGRTSFASMLVKNEHLALQRLGKADSIADCVPKSTAYWEDPESGECVLVQSTVGQSMTPSSSFPDTGINGFLARLCDLQKKEVRSEKIARNIGVTGLCDELRDKQSEVSRLLLQALGVLGSGAGGKYITVPSHGDFAPWNVLRSAGENDLFIIDWEYWSTETPALLDLFHYVFMPARLVDKRRPLSAVNMLRELCQSDNTTYLKERCRISFGEWDSYVLWYFLWLAVREAKNDGVSCYLQKCIRILMNQMSIGVARPKVLVGAYACEPGEGSEPGVGWNWVEQIAKEADVHVITRANNRDAIAQEMAGRPSLKIAFSYVDLPKWLAFWKRGQRGVRTYYYIWQFAAFLKARRLDREEHFDLAHHVTFVNDWLWSFVALLPIPYIWGPIGSHPPCPRYLITRKQNSVKETLRLAIQSTFRVIDPLYWFTLLRAARVVVISPESFRKIPLRFAATARRRVEPAIGMERLHIGENVTGHRSGYTVLFVGRYHYTKCPQLVVESFARVLPRLPGARLVMIGAGPERLSLSNIATTLKIQHAVTLSPHVPRSDVLKAMSKADLFLFPSTEGGGMVVLEAMALGLPVICLDYGGPGEMVHGEGGVCVPIGNKERVVDGLSKAVAELLESDRRRQDIGRLAKKKVIQRYEWDRIGEFVKQEYQAVIKEEIAHG